MILADEVETSNTKIVLNRRLKSACRQHSPETKEIRTGVKDCKTSNISVLINIRNAQPAVTRNQIQLIAAIKRLLGVQSNLQSKPIKSDRQKAKRLENAH